MFERARASHLLSCLVVPIVLVMSACGDDPGGGDGGKGGGGGTTVVEPQTPTPTPTPPKKMWAERESGREDGFRGCGHGMETKASFYPGRDRVFASTDIWSHCGFGGFTGTAWVELVDDAGVPVGMAFSPDTWGVKGKAEAAVTGGYFERFGLAWDAPVVWRTNADAYMLDHIEVSNHHAPRNRLLGILMEGLSAGKKAVAIYQQVMAEYPSS
jgi:hypothetical protein